MRFSVFSADPLKPHVQCYSSTGLRGHRCPRMANSRASSPPSSWPTAATFVPVMFMGGPGHTGYPGHHTGHHTGGHPGHHCHHPGHQSDPHQRGPRTAGPQPPHQLPPFCMSDCLSQPVISDAVSLAQGLLGELLGQHGAEKGGQPAGKKPSSQRSSPGHRCDGSSSASCCTQSSDMPRKSCPQTSRSSAQMPSQEEKKSCPQTSSAQMPSQEEKKADSESSPKATKQRGKEKSEGEKAESCPPNTVPAQPLWSHSLYFPRFSPNKISAKVKDGKLHVRAVREKSGPSTCLSKMEATRVVALPENVDQKTLICTMKLDGALLLQAQLKENRAVEAKENKAETMEDEPEENKAETMDALEDEPEENTAADVHGSNDSHEQATTEADSEAAEVKTDEEERLADSESCEPTEKEAACCKGEPEEDQTAEQQLCSRPADEAQGGVCEELENEPLSLQADMEDNVHKPATAEENPITFAIIQEPEDESSSSDEETPSNHTLSHQSSTEDFVVIEQGSVNTGNASYADSDGVSEAIFQASEERALLDQAPTEAGEEPTDSTPDDTDPTRPVNRSSGGPQPPQELELNSTMPGEQRGTSVDGHSSGAVHPHHAAFRVSLPLVGFSPQNVRVNLEGRTLHIAATRQAWAGGAPYTESMQRQLQLPEHLDVLTVRCVYEQDDGCLLVSAEAQDQQRQVPVVLQ